MNSAYMDSAFLEQQVIGLLRDKNGLNDREISEKMSIRLSVEYAGIVCRQLEYKGLLQRVRVKGKPIENHLK